ncbi:MAG: GWxTD domain-containing protein [Balneolaceae bacterium]|nr:GWxTD domain-containing protein [Balneolaceae bacterium]
MVVLLIALLLPFTPVSTATGPDPPTAQQLFEEGLEAEERGDYKEALDIWLSAKVELDHPSLRVGRNYIRLATEQGMEDYYQAASAMYQWGLSGEDVTFQKEHVMAELAYLEPLLGEDQQAEWNRLLEDNDPALLERMTRWWSSVDPTPATPYNERLVEHWQRIAYAREHYTRGDGSVYGTDDRGVAYVRYGEPERKFADTFSISGQDASSLTNQLLAAWGMGGGYSFARAMKNAVRQLFIPPPRYEVWVYEGQYLGTRDNVLQLFGEVQGGPFRQVSTLDELIPNSAFTLSSRFAYQGMGGAVDYPINPAMLLQYLVYREMIGMDPILSRNFSRLDRELFRYNGGNPPGKHYPQIAQQRHVHDARERAKEAPEEASTITKDLGDIPLEVHQYRLLGEAGGPVFATFLESRPQQRFLEDLAANQDSMFAGLSDSAQVRAMLGSYQLFHGVRLQGPDGRTLSGTRYRPPLRIDGSDMQVASGSAFTIPFAGDSAEQVFYAELHNRNPKSAPQVETPFPDHLRGLGRLTVPQPEPLDPDPSKLQMGDLILGYALKDSASAGSFLPFVVANDKQIPEGQELALHVEVYHLQENAEGIRDFSLDYEIRPVNFLGWTRERQDQLSLTLNFEQAEARFTEDLSIKAAGLEPGRYVLRMRATDHTGGQEAYREIEFEVVEAEESGQAN